MTTARTNDRESTLASAAEWVMRLRDPAISPTAIRDWMAWCDAAAENKAAFGQMQALWEDMGDVEPRPIDASVLAADGYDGQTSVAEWRDFYRGGVSIKECETNAMVRASHSRRYFLAAAAGVAALALGFVVIEDFQRRDLVVVTPNGVNERVKLPDGSQAVVGGGSRIATHFTAGERSVFLERGEAFFQVHKDAVRPFVVHALDSSVTAIGTAFNISAEQGVVKVAVTEGVVEMDRRSTNPAESQARAVDNVRIQAGNQATLAMDDVEPRVAPVDVQQAVSWVSGTLKFVNEPMAQVVSAVNRNSTRTVQLGDSALGEYRFTGTVVASRLDEWLRGLPNIFPVTVRDVAPRGSAGSDGSAAATVIERRGDTASSR